MCYILDFLWNSTRECMIGVHSIASQAHCNARAGATTCHLQVRQNLLFEFHQHSIGDLDLQRACNQNIRI
jgi:hypothetical protein